MSKKTINNFYDDFKKHKVEYGTTFERHVKLIDDLEIDSYSDIDELLKLKKIKNKFKKYANIALYTFIAIGLIVVILSPYIIDYFTK